MKKFYDELLRDPSVGERSYVNRMLQRCCAILVLALFSMNVSGQDMYAITGSGNSAGNLYTIDLVANTATFVGAVGYSHTSSLALDPTTGILYTVANDQGGGGAPLLLTVNTATGVGTPVASLSGMGTENISDLTFDPSGQLYGFVEPASDDLAKINKATGAVTILPGAPGSSRTGIEYDPGSGTIIQKRSTDSYQLNASTGASMGALASHGFTLHNMLTRDNAGIYYSGQRHPQFGGGGTDMDLYTLNPFTGATTLLFNIPVGNIAGLASILCEPVVSCPADVDSALVGQCSAEITFDTGNFCDCSDWRGIRSDGGVDLTEANGYTGTFAATCDPVTIDWQCTDAGGAVSIFCTSTVNITEAIDPANEPNAICAGNLTLGLGSDGTVELCAGAYGGLSNDDCGDVILDIHVIGEPYTDCIVFDCDDIGPNNICLRVRDCFGNESLCYGTITVQDKDDPYIVCPADITIECHVDNSDGVGGPNPGPDLDGILVPFSQTEYDAAEALRASGGPTPGQDATNGITGFAQGWDNCGATISYSDVSTQDPDETSCNHYNYTVTRTWVITDFGVPPNDNDGDGNLCVQTITVQDTGFPWFSEECDELNVVLDCDDPNYELDYDYALSLEPTPNDLCYVTMTLTGDIDTGDLPNCISYTDCMGNLVNQVSQQRKRTWTAVDACGNATIYEQYITTIDTTAPAIACPNGGSSQTFYTSTVDDCDLTSETCAAWATLVATATDCQAGIVFEHQLKDANGVNIGSLKPGPDASGCYEVGSYCVEFTATDDCGNASTCLSFFNIVDDENPIIDCSPAIPDFVGPFAPANWTTDLNGGNGSVSHTATTLTMTSSNNGTVGNVERCITIPNTGILNFDWSFTTSDVDGGSFDPFGYSVNGPFIQLTGGGFGSQSGTVSIAVNAGDLFCFNQNTLDAILGSATSITNMFIFESPLVDITQTADPDMCSAEITTPTPTFTDNCPGAFLEVEIIGAWTEANVGVDNIIYVVTPGDDITLTYPVGVTTLIYTVYDASGNASGSCIQVITVTDDQAPTSANCPTDITLLTSLDGIANYDCSAPLNWKSPIIDENCKLATYTCTLTLPDGTVVGPTNTVSDASQTFDFPVGTTNVKYDVADEAGNIYCCTYNVTVLDDENPAMICQDITVELGADGTYVMDPSEIDNGSNDNCPGLVLTASQTIFNCLHLGENLITLTGTDAAGNSAECWATVTVVDLLDPELTCTITNSTSGFQDDFDPANWTLTTNGGNGSVDLSNAPASISISSSDNSASFGNINTDYCVTIPSTGVLTFDWDYSTLDWGSFYDPFGYVHNGTFVVLTAGLNNGPPGPGPDESGTAVVNVTAGDTFCFRANTTDDGVGAATTISDMFLFESLTFIHGTSDDGTGDCSYTATGGEFDPAVSDNTDPLCPLTLTYLITDATGATTASGNAAGTTASLDGVAFIACNSPYVILWTATDVAGNTVTCTNTIVVLDDELPTPIFRPGLVNCGDVIEKDSDPLLCGTSYSWIDFTLADFADNCDADGCGLASIAGPFSPVECLGEPAGLRTANFPVGCTDVDYLVTDVAGNTYVCTFTVCVEDIEPPFLACPDDQNLNVDLTCLNPVLDDFQGQTDYSDNCPGVTLVQSPAAGTSLSGNSAGDVIAITMTATDASGLTSTCTFNVTLVDEEGVNIVCNVPYGIDEVAADENCEVTLGDYAAAASYQSTCNPGLVLSPYQDPAVGTVISDTTTVTVSVDDGNGNISSCSFQVIPVDETAPTCPALPDVTVDAASGCSAVATFSAANADDNCDGPASVVGVQTGGPASGSFFPAGSTEIEYTYTDAALNETVCTFNVIVTHNEPLTIICDGVTAGMNSAGFAEVCAISFDEGSSSFCGSPLTYEYTTDVDIFGTAAPGAVFSECMTWTCADLIPGQESTSMEIIFRATDTVSGEQADCLTSLTLSDDTAPQITQCPADVTVNTSNNGLHDCEGEATLQLFEATDNCSVAYSYTIEYADGNTGSGLGQDASGIFPTGESTITYTVEDPSGNRRSTCQTTVTVVDDEAPLCQTPNLGGDPLEEFELFISLAGGNGQSGNMFNIIASDDITVETFDLHIGAFGTETVEIYTKAGSMVGFANNAGAWTLAGTTTVTAQGAGNLTPVPLSLGIEISAGSTQAFYVTLQSTNIDYTNGTGTPGVTPWASDANMVLTQGYGNAYPFGGFFSPRNFNGQVHYTKGAAATGPLEDIVVDAAPGACGQIVDYDPVLGFDNCAVISSELIAGLPSGSVFPVGTTFVNHLLTDGAGLTVECGFNVTVNDVNPPVLTCPEDIITASDADLCTAQLVVEPDVLDECAEAMVEICFDFLDSPESTSWTLLNEFGLVVDAATAGTYSENECVIIDVNPGNYELVVEGFFGTYTVSANGMTSTYTTDPSAGEYSAEVALLTDVEIVWTATGAFQTEMGYEVFDANGDYVYFDGYGLTGTVGEVEETMSLIGGQPYTMRVMESFGDGWHGNTLQLHSPNGSPLTLNQTVGTGGTATNMTVVPTDPSYIAISSGNMVPGPGTNQEYAEFEFTPPSSSGTGELCIQSDVLGGNLSFEFLNTTTNTVLASGAAGSFGNDDLQCFSVDFVSGDSYELSISGFLGEDAFFTVTDPSGIVVQSASGDAPQTNSMFAATGGTSGVECSYVVTNADGDVIGSGNGLSGAPAPATYNLELITTAFFDDEMGWALSGPGGLVDSAPFGTLDGVAPGTIATFNLEYGTTYTFEAVDSFGDSWDSGTMELQTSSGTPVLLTDLTAGGTTTVIATNSSDPDYVSGLLGSGFDPEVHTYEFTTPLLEVGFAYPLGENTITWTCVDESDNSATCSTTVTVNDEQDPNISCPDDITTLTDAGDCFAALSLEAPEVSDNGDACIPAEPDCASSRDVNVIYFDDGSFDGEHAYVIFEGGGLTSAAGATVVAQQGYNIPNIGEGNTIETVSLTPGVTYTFAAIDDFGDGWDGFDVQLQLADDNSVILVNNLNTGGNGQTTIGNLSNADIVSNDFSGPLGGSGSRTDSYTLYEFEIPCTPAAGTHAITTSLITFPDGTTQAGSGTVNEDFPPGTSTVEYTATDAAGNTSSCTTTINVADEEDPICNAPTVQATYNVDPGTCEACITMADFSSADNCMVAFSGHNSAFADSPGENASGCYPVGAHTVKYFSNDMFGNACVTEINFEVIDNEAPTGNAPADITVCNDQLPLPTCTATNTDLGTPSFDDNCGIATVTNDDDGLHILGDNLITWTVTDIHGNVSTFTQTVTVEDCNAPVIDCPADINVSTTLGGDCFVTVEGLDLDISDNCEIPNLSLVICTDDNSELTDYVVSTGSDPNLTYEMTTSTTGSFDNEVGWQLFNSNGDVVFEWEGNLNPLPGPGTSVQTWNLEANETYTLEAVDSFGDGWNGNSFIIDDLGNPVVLTDVTGGGGTTTTVVVNNNDPSYSGDLFPGGFGPEVHIYEFTTPASDYVEYASGDAGDLAGNDGGCTTIPLPAIAGDFDVTITNLFGTYEVVTETGTVLTSGSGGTSAPQLTASFGPSLSYAITVGTSGSFDNEVGWQLFNSNGDVVFEWEGDQNPLPTGAGTVIQTWNLEFDETYTLEAVDSFGDGWNGNTFIIDNNGAPVVLEDITSGGTTTTVVVNSTDPAYTGDLFPTGFGPEFHVYEFTTPPNPEPYSFELTPNVSADQLSWVLTDESNAVIDSAPAGTYAGTEGSTSSVAIAAGSATNYTLTIDGLHVGGSYAVLNAQGGTVTGGSAGDVVINDTYSLVGASFTVEYLIDFGPGDSTLTGSVIPFDQDFPVGTSTITWNATDENGNTSDDCVTTVTVSDVNPPQLLNPTGCDDGANTTGGVVDFGSSLELELEIGADLAITDIPSIGITGMFNNDFSSLAMFLQSPGGTLVQLIDGGDYPGCGFIFNGFTIETGGSGASACPGTDGNPVNPANPLSAFDGESSQGTWTLIVTTDNPLNDGGVIFGWSLDVCGELTACAENVTVDADENCEGTVTLPIPNAVDCDELSYFYSLDGGTTLESIPGDDVTLTFPLGEHMVTWLVVDEASNTVSCGTIVTVEDNTAPVLTCPADATANSGQFVCDAPVTLALATVSDNCSSPTITNDYNNGGADASDTYPVGVTLVTFTATDDAGNVSTCTTTVTVIDDIDPIISCGSTLNFNLPISGILEVPAQLFAAASYDNCGDPTITIEGQATFTFDCTMVGLNEGMTVTATDGSGNSASCWIDVLIKDEIAIECTGGSVDGGTADCVTGTFEVTAAGMTAPTFTDNVVFADCPWTIETSVDGVSGPIAGFYAPGTYEACWTATGSDGTTATCCATFTVDPAGDYTCPSDVTLDADANCEAFATLAVLDNCTDPLSVSNDSPFAISGGADASGTYPLGSTLVTFTIIDAWGNPASCSATVTVEDNTAPSITCPASPVSASADPGLCETYVITGDATATDNCSVSISNNSAYADASGANASGTYPVGTHTVTFTATDGAGNTDTCDITIIVTDDEDPTCGAPADISVNASDDGYDCGAFAGGLVATPTDNCAIGSVVHDSPYADLNDPNVGDASGVYPVGTTVVTFFVTDVNGNVVSCQTSVTVVDDLGPALSCPADLTVCNDAGVCGANLSPTASSSENCDIDRIDYTITFEDGSTVDGTSTGLANTHLVAASAFYPVGTHSVAYTAYDLVGNSATCSTTITVNDCEAPACAAQDITVALDGSGNASITAADVDNGSTDNCGILSMTVAPSAFDCSNTGANTVTLTVNDIHGNTSTCTATVTIVDDETPLCAAQDLTVELDAAGLATITAAQVDNGSSDNCDVALSIDIDTFNCNDVDNLGGPVTVTLTVTDPSGNSSNCTSTVTVEDNIAPVLTCPADVDSSNAKGECGNYVIAIANASDNCSVIITNDSPYADAAGGDASGYYPVGSHVVTFVATDPSGNTDTCTTTITVIDDEAPNVICIELITATLISQGTVIVPACAIDNGSFDNCTSNGDGDCISSDLTYLINGQASLLLDCSNLGINEVTLTVIDEAGNSASCETFIDVQDNDAPIIDALPQATYSADFDPAASCGAFVAIPVPTTTDICPGVTLVNDYNGTADASDEYPIGTTTVTWWATDAAGNTSDYSIDVIVGNIPAATGLSSECNGTQFRLNWNTVDGTAGYKVFLQTASGTPIANALFMNPAQTTTGWINNAALPAGDYEFRIFTGCLIDPASNPNVTSNYAVAVTAWVPLTLPCTTPLANYDEEVVETTDNSTDDKVLDNDNANMIVYPNPNIGQFTIETDLEFYTLEVLDMTGKVIFREESLTDNVYRAELSTVESGVYFIKLIGDNQILTKRVIIEK